MDTCRKLSTDARQVLADARCDGYLVTLPDCVMDMALLAEIDDAMRLAGGVWRDGGYHFVVEPGPMLESVIAAGVVAPVDPAVVFSFGMGVESVSILLRWLEDPTSRDFPLSRLIVITAQTGDEFRDLEPLILEHIIPRLAAAGVRWVQVARAGGRQEDGIVVLEDSRRPTRAYLDGAFKLSDELTAAGTVPQVASGRRLCSLKAKGWPLDTWLEQIMAGRAFRHVMGFNADETDRMARDSSYSTVQRSSEYPLAAWGWSREICELYIYHLTAVWWPKSCCAACPFAFKVNSVAMGRHLDRFRAEPEAAADALLMEHLSLALNPRMTLYASRSLRSVLEVSPGMEEVWAVYERKLAALPWAVYRVQRYYHARGRADRRTEKLTGEVSEADARAVLAGMPGEAEEEAGEVRVYSVRRGEGYPAREEFCVAAPAVVAEKCRPGFVARWESA